VLADVDGRHGALLLLNDLPDERAPRAVLEEAPQRRTLELALLHNELLGLRRRDRDGGGRVDRARSGGLAEDREGLGVRAVRRVEDVEVVVILKEDLHHTFLALGEAGAQDARVRDGGAAAGDRRGDGRHYAKKKKKKAKGTSR
jgi:hypothetical protein